MNHEWVLILDFGGQYTQLIARAIRRAHVFCEIYPHHLPYEEFEKMNKPAGIILSGGPESVYEENAPQIDPSYLESGVPILGICYGMQYLNFKMGGEMAQEDEKTQEFGEVNIKVNTGHILYRSLPDEVVSWMSHGDSVNEEALAPGFQITARSEKHVASVYYPEKQLYGVQFHPEVSHMPRGKDILESFLFQVCSMSGDWSMDSFLKEAREYIQETVGNKNVISFVSGGVDSSFVSALLNTVEGIGKVFSIYIEGLMRKGENLEVENSLKKAGIDDLIIVDARTRFIEALEGESDPEKKRKIVGNLFGILQEEACEQLGLNPEYTMLAQGTLYTDLVESGKGVGKKAHNIKSHHNVGCEFIENLKAKGQVVEPNRMIFKDEVRLAARELGLPQEITQRQPFPGPGLTIRMVHGSTEFYDANIIEQEKRIQEITRNQSYQSHILPVRTVGVQGDQRTYKNLLLLDGEQNWKEIRSLTRELPGKFQSINRVVYLVNDEEKKIKAPHRALACTVNQERFELLQKIDHKGREVLDRYGFSPRLSQTIFVLFGADPFETGKLSVALRAVITDDFMTVTPAIPLKEKELIGCARSGQPVSLSWKCLVEIKNTLTRDFPVGAFVYDVTDKPPATTCWE